MTRLGILGGGQLGMMIAESAKSLGVECLCVDSHSAVPAARVVPVMAGRFEDQALLEALARRVDRVTYEFENVPLEAAEWLAERMPVSPPPAALRVAQERLEEKMFLAGCGLEVAPHQPVETINELRATWKALGQKAVLKTRRFGYDGKGQALIRSEDELEAAWKRLSGRPLILEGLVDFEREVSIVAARWADGRVACYPLVENHHAGGILRWSIAPAPNVSAELQTEAERLAGLVLAELEYIGVGTIEFFLSRDGRLVANEMAPRVHNSGHWTIEGANVSQFELHARAICDLEAPKPEIVVPDNEMRRDDPEFVLRFLDELGAFGDHDSPTYDPASAATERDRARELIASDESRWLMANIIGDEAEGPIRDLVPSAFWHPYNKSPRPLRKLGHVTIPL